jgi:histidine ammonia-lyase
VTRRSIPLDGRTLTPERVTRIAVEHEPAHLTRRALQRNRQAVDTARQLLADGVTVYGRNTGVGGLLDADVEGAAAVEHSRRLLRSHASGTGALLPAEVARGTLVVRANQLGAGGGGIEPGVLHALVDALNAGLAPVLHEVGSLGIGDVTTLAEVGLALLGEGGWLGGMAGPPPAPIGQGDAIVLMSSNASTLGEAAVATHRLDTVLRSAESVAAMAFLASRADPVVLDERVQAARPHPGQAAVATHLRALIGPGTGAARRQDPLCLRCLPQVHGAARDAHSDLVGVLRVELNAAGENPLLDPVAGQALTSGNFHGAPTTLALDQVRAAIAQTASQSVQRVSLLLDGRVPGLPVFLAADPPGSSGAMILEWTAHAALAELRATAAPVLVGASVVSLGQEDHVSAASQAARQLSRTVEHYVTVLAVELVTAVRALRLAGLAPPTEQGRSMFERARAELPTGLEDRELSSDLEIAAELLRSGELAATASEVWLRGTRPDIRPD